MDIAGYFCPIFKIIFSLLFAKLIKVLYFKKINQSSDQTIWMKKNRFAFSFVISM